MHLFSFRIEGGSVPSAHTLPHLPSLFALSLLGIGDIGSALGSATWTLDSVDPFILSTPSP